MPRDLKQVRVPLGQIVRAVVLVFQSGAVVFCKVLSYLISLLMDVTPVNDDMCFIILKLETDPKWCISCLHSAQLICLWGPAPTSPIIATRRILSFELVNILLA